MSVCPVGQFGIALVAVLLMWTNLSSIPKIPLILSE